MDSYSSKILELLEVYSTEQPQIKIRLTLEEKVELLWDVDTALAEHLHQVLQLDEQKNYRYRLSLTSFWDSSQSQYFSSISRTYRDHSDTLYFPCSEDYIHQLQKVKHITHVKQLRGMAQPWAEVDLQTTTKGRSKRSRLLPVAAASLAIALVVGLTSYFYYNPLVLAKSSAASSVPSIEMQHPANIEALPLRMPQSYELAQTAPVSYVTEAERSQGLELLEQQEPTMPDIPFVDLTDIISYRVPDGTVALTFDDGPSEYTKQIVDTLLEHNVGGTFFFIGENVSTYPDAVAYAHSNGFTVGNHSYNHRDYTRLGYEEQELDLLKTRQLIEEITATPTYLFRPPYGANNHDTFGVMEATDSKMVLWNSDPEDWKYRNDESILEYVTSNKASGAIILLHETPETVNALPRLIEYLRQQQLEIVNLK